MSRNVQVSNGPGASLFGSSSMWNDYRKRFGEIIQQEYGATFLGESWYAEGDTPLGPWVFTRKVVTHVRLEVTDAQGNTSSDEVVVGVTP